jgi:hypothetical protein
MANRYRYVTKNSIGKVYKTDNTVFAEDIKHAVEKFLDDVDSLWVDNNQEYIQSQLVKVDCGKNYTVINMKYNNRPLEAYIERIEEGILK